MAKSGTPGAAMLLLGAACNPPPTWIGTLHGTGGDSGSLEALSNSSETGSPVTTTGDTDPDDDGELLPPSEPMSQGCRAIDLLFVIDNSASMALDQIKLITEFPQFVDTMLESLAPGVDLHVGITTTDFDHGCVDLEATQMCQSTATYAEVLEHYMRPDVVNDGGNGTQGRLFEHEGRRYFSAWSHEDPALLGAWFQQAAMAVGTSGCTFEMPVAAAGFVAHPANATTNAGFLRDEEALLVVFVITDEPDKSVEADELYRDMILEAKAGCGSEACVLVGGLGPACVADINQKLWQFMNQFGEAPIYGDIEATYESSQVFSRALGKAVANACRAMDPEGE